MGTYLAKLGVSLALAFAGGGLGAVLGGLYGATQRNEFSVEGTADYAEALAVIKATHGIPPEPTAPEDPGPLRLDRGAGQLLADMDKQKRARVEYEQAREAWAAQRQEQEQRDKLAARLGVIDAGCQQCASKASDYAFGGAVIGGLLPTLAVGWFGLLYVLSEISRAVRGQGPT